MSPLEVLNLYKSEVDSLRWQLDLLIEVGGTDTPMYERLVTSMEIFQRGYEHAAAEYAAMAA